MSKKQKAKLPLRTQQELDVDYTKVCQQIVALDMQKATIEFNLHELRQEVMNLAKEASLIQPQAAVVPQTNEPKADEQA